MKPIIRKTLSMIGTLCLAGTVWIHYKGTCLLFFGEYPYPEE